MTVNPDHVFIQQHVKLLATATGIARDVFPPDAAMSVRVQHDPEEASCWIVLDVCSSASWEVMAEAYRRYVTSWVSESPSEDRSLVRLSYSSHQV